MILESTTKDILKNFSAINNQMLITPGKVIRSMSISEDLLAYANIKDEFTETCGVHDLSRLLGVLSIFTEPNVDFKPNVIEVSTDRQRINLTAAHPSMLKGSLDYEVELEGSVEFTLAALDLGKVVKATSMLSHSEVILRGRDGTLTFEGTNLKDPTSDTFSLDVGKTDKTFEVFVPRDRFIFMNRDYQVTVSNDVGLKLASPDVTYYICYIADAQNDFGDL